MRGNVIVYSRPSGFLLQGRIARPPVPGWRNSVNAPGC